MAIDEEKDPDEIVEDEVDSTAKEPKVGEEPGMDPKKYGGLFIGSDDTSPLGTSPQQVEPTIESDDISLASNADNVPVESVFLPMGSGLAGPETPTISPEAERPTEPAPAPGVRTPDLPDYSGIKFDKGRPLDEQDKEGLEQLKAEFAKRLVGASR